MWMQLYLLNSMHHLKVWVCFKEQGHHIDEYIFANVGTGTSLHYFDGKQQRRVGGVGTGGV